MQMLYNSDNFAVVQFEVPSAEASTSRETLSRGGYEIVDKFARKEIFIEALIETSPSEEEMDDYIERYASLMQHPLVLH